MSMSPRIKAVAMSGEVRKVTIVALMPAVLVNSSAARFWVLPGKVVPMLNLPGLALAAATTSASDLCGEPARVTINRSKNEAVETEAKSVRMLYGSLLNSEAAMALLLPVINSV